MPIDSSCPHCTSTNLIKSGKTKSQQQRYKCKDCNKTFTGNANGRPASGLSKAQQQKARYQAMTTEQRRAYNLSRRPKKKSGNA